MECPHLRDSVKVNRDFIKNKKYELSKNSGNRASTESNTNGSVLWKCLECTSDRENWMCLNCGQVLCGRYENRHALHHSKMNTHHNICFNTLNYSVYCYICDDYISGNHLVDNLREEFKDDDSSSEASGSLDEISSEKSSKDSSDSGCYDESAPDDLQNGRRLRPRKRTNSNTNSNSENNANESPKKKKAVQKILGLLNLGNTCFMNSVVQALHNIEEFSLYFNSLPSLETKSPQPKRCYYSRSQKDSVSDANVAEELRKVLITLTKGSVKGSKAISPENLFSVIWNVVPQFRGHRQHDAHEFLRYMLDRLDTELQGVTIPSDSNNGTHKSSNKDCNGSEGSSLSLSLTSEPSNTRNRSSIVSNTFGGTLHSEVRCLICGMKSKKHDPFLDLSLDIPQKYYNETNANSRPVCSLAECLSSFTEVEELAETELYYCNSCKCKQKSTKRFWIRRLPNVLCLHIKRFRWNNFFRTKIDLRIKFPLKSLDMSQYLLNNVPETRTRRSSLNNNIYDLAAVIVHHGNGSSCGHYTSYAKNKGTWLQFNDATVKEVQTNTVQDCKPYILFYTRRNANNST